MSGEDTLDAALEGRSDNFKQKVIDVVRRSSININKTNLLVLRNNSPISATADLDSGADNGGNIKILK